MAPKPGNYAVLEAIQHESVVDIRQVRGPIRLRLRTLPGVRSRVVVSEGTRLLIPVPDARPAGSFRSERLVDVQREHIRFVLQSVRWRIRGTGGAAERLGLRPTTLETRMARLGLFRPKAS